MKKTLIILVGLITFSCDNSKEKAFQARCTAVDGRICSSILLKDSWNQHILDMKEIENEYKVMGKDTTIDLFSGIDTVGMFVQKIK